jgi:hypothetical protein
MNKKILTAAAALGLFAGGLALGQFMDGDAGRMDAVKPSTAVQTASTIYTDYVTGSIAGGSAVQISQVADEANIRMQYIIVKQNAEIIRLLDVISKKK